MIRQFGPAEALFIIEAVRWTVLLSVVAFIGGGIGGLGVALARTAPSAWLRDVAAGYIQLFQGTPCRCSCSWCSLAAPCSAPASIRWPPRRSH
jgi:His/Glu/Gln/Arg/opine family amino acid ABC transporter permease subunit